LAEVCGARRLGFGDEIAHTLLAGFDDRDARAFWALSRLSASPVTLDALRAGVQSSHAEVRPAAALGLLRQARDVALRELASEARIAGEWALLCLALAGVRAAGTALRERVSSGRATPLALYSLGMLGEASSVRLLCNQ